jgi:hypothetical protein
MKIKERHPSSTLEINHGTWEVEISKYFDGWTAWNTNGLLYYNGIWVERLEEEPKIHIQDAIKENTVVHCETEQEAKRILGMAHELGYKWLYGASFKDYNNWDENGNDTCYYLFKGMYGSLRNHINKDYIIISSTQIADLETEKSTDLSPAPEDIKAMKKEKASESQIGGSHYSNMAIQPIEFIHKNGLSFIQGNIIKYVCRYKLKGGVQDLNKAKHYIDLLIEFEEENN